MEETPTKPKRRLSKKQRGFVKDYVATGNGTQAALNNYDIESSNPGRVANAIAVENLSKPAIKEAILSIAERIPDDLLARVHLEGLEANNEIVKDGQVLVSIPDYAVRHKYLDSAYKLKGSYAPDKSVTVNVDVAINQEDLEVAKQLLETRRLTEKLGHATLNHAGSEGESVQSNGAVSVPVGGEVQNQE